MVITWYCRANQEWQWRIIMFTIVKYNINVHYTWANVNP